LQTHCAPYEGAFACMVHTWCLSTLQSLLVRMNKKNVLYFQDRKHYAVIIPICMFAQSTTPFEKSFREHLIINGLSYARKIEKPQALLLHRNSAHRVTHRVI